MKPCLQPLAVGFIKLLPNTPWWFLVPLGFGDTASDWKGHGIDLITGKSKKVSG